MKCIQIVSLCFLFFSCALLSGCKKDVADPVAPLKNIDGAAYLKFYDAAVNTSRNHVFIDNSKITGTAIASGGVFPSGAFYSAFSSGTRTFVVKDTLATTTQNVISLYQNFEAGKNYTFFLYDSTNAVKQKIVTDVIEVPTDTSARIRFANFIYSPTAVPNVDVYSYLKGGNVFTDISPTTVTNFIPYASIRADSFFVRPTGTTTNLAKLALNPAAKRSYTLVFRGSYGAATGTNARTLSSFLNY